MLNEDATIRLVQPHEQLEGNDYHEWVVTKKRMKASKTGVVNSRIQLALWTQFVCNNPDCAGWGLTNLDLLVAAEVRKSFETP